MQVILTKIREQAGAELSQAQGKLRASLGLSGLDLICSFCEKVTWIWLAKLAYEFNFGIVIVLLWSIWYG